MDIHCTSPSPIFSTFFRYRESVLAVRSEGHRLDQVELKEIYKYVKIVVCRKFLFHSWEDSDYFDFDITHCIKLDHFVVETST